MKKSLLAFLFTLALVAMAAAGTVKLTFPDTLYPDGRLGTIEASVKTTGNGSQLTVCSYFADPNFQYLGQYQANTSFSPVIADDVKQFCLDNFDNRTPAK